MKLDGLKISSNMSRIMLLNSPSVTIISIWTPNINRMPIFSHNASWMMGVMKQPQIGLLNQNIDQPDTPLLSLSMVQPVCCGQNSLVKIHLTLKTLLHIMLLRKWDILSIQLILFIAGQASWPSSWGPPCGIASGRCQPPSIAKSTEGTFKYSGHRSFSTGRDEWWDPVLQEKGVDYIFGVWQV